MPAKKTENPEVENRIHQNMRFYALVQDTPKEAQKSFNNGRFSGTDINPMWRIKKLTEVFGPAGFGWWTQNVKYEFVEAEETKETSVFCELELVVVDPETEKESHPIYGVGGNTYVAQRRNGPQSSDEAKKMAYTDALSIACKALGFSHDIYYQADRTKYTGYDIETEAKPKKTTQKQETPQEGAAPSVPETAPAEHTVETATIISEIASTLSKIGENMDKETKLKFATDMILPITGDLNYKKCKDVNKLIALRDKLNSYAA